MNTTLINLRIYFTYRWFIFLAFQVRFFYITEILG